ncbi:MAG: hypothetical protein LBR64_09040 [Dysgonamonadaceae bacterium]|jgi:hypothetical protein|nr:hypothetical protein [Dysgonamonadaceae bacterium]
MEKKVKLVDFVKAEPFKAPDGYFDSLTETIMAKLPEPVREAPVTISLWQRAKPWVYMAAMFTGIYLMISIFTHNPGASRQEFVKTYASEGLDLTSSSEIDDFYRYYEDELAKMVYDDAFYATAYQEE